MLKNILRCGETSVVGCRLMNERSQVPTGAEPAQTGACADSGRYSQPAHRRTGRSGASPEQTGACRRRQLVLDRGATVSSASIEYFLTRAAQ